MTMPDEVYAIFAAVAKKFPEFHRGDDDQRREATRRTVATIRARLKGSGPLDGTRWVHKTQHANGAAPSKDAFAYVPEGPIEHLRHAEMFVFDTINGATREPYPPGIHGEWVKQYILVVEPHDWLGDNGGGGGGGGKGGSSDQLTVLKQILESSTRQERLLEQILQKLSE